MNLEQRARAVYPDELRVEPNGTALARLKWTSFQGAGHTDLKSASRKGVLVRAQPLAPTRADSVPTRIFSS